MIYYFKCSCICIILPYMLTTFGIGNLKIVNNLRNYFIYYYVNSLLLSLLVS